MRVLAAIIFVLMALPAHAQNMQRALVVSSCGGQALPAGPLTNLTMNPQGQLCLAGIGGGTSPPVNSVAPVASGTLTVGSLLSSTTGTWSNSPTGYAYQWQRGGVNIGGATSSTYTTVTADGGTSVGSQVTASNAGGSNSALSNTLAIAPAYSGPGDAVSGAVFWGGLRAYNGAYAASGGKSVNLRRASDNATCDFAVSSTGGLGVSVATCATGLGLTPAAFATQDATASCTIATNTATCTGASSTPHVGSTITGSGVGQPCYATAVGTFTAGAGTVTLAGGLGVGSAPCGTVGSAATLTFTYGLYATKLYDQSGASACSGSCDVSQATAAKQPQFQPSCLNSLPCLGFITASAQTLVASAANTAVTTAGTISLVSVRTGLVTTINRIFGQSNSLIYMFYSSVANTASLTQGSTINATVSDNIWHSLGFIFASSAASFIDVDGAVGVTGNTGASAWSTAFALSGSGAALFLTGYATEIGLWSTAVTSPQATSLCHNQFTYWGTPTSC